MTIDPQKIQLPNFRIMGIVNVTPDSFSDGSLFLNPDQAVHHALCLLRDGADIIDVGAESSRPGSDPISEEDEWKRLEPVLAALRESSPGVEISVDTYKPGIMLKAAEYGVSYINNIKGLADEATLKTLASQGLSYIAMHMHGAPKVMQNHPMPGSCAIQEVQCFFNTAQETLLQAGFCKDKIYMDPGIGFGKSISSNLRLLAATPQLSASFQMALGVSRKFWIGRCLGIEEALKRDDASKMIELGLAIAGADLIRTHEVKRLAHMRRGFFEEVS